MPVELLAAGGTLNQSLDRESFPRRRHGRCPSILRETPDGDNVTKDLESFLAFLACSKPSPAKRSTFNVQRSLRDLFKGFARSGFNGSSNFNVELRTLNPEPFDPETAFRVMPEKFQSAVFAGPLTWCSMGQLPESSDSCRC